MERAGPDVGDPIRAPTRDVHRPDGAVHLTVGNDADDQAEERKDDPRSPPGSGEPDESESHNGGHKQEREHRETSLPAAGSMARTGVDVKGLREMGASLR